MMAKNRMIFMEIFHKFLAERREKASSSLT